VSNDPTQPPVPPPPPDATIPYWITIEDGRIVDIEDQFLP
jgi:hypothetical protein